jgi:hypothetical protein
MQGKGYNDRTARYMARRTFAATPEEVHEASRDFAGYVGWVPLAPDSASFELAHIGPIAAMWGGPVLNVATYHDGDKTDAQFEVSAELFSWVPKELERAAEAFAEGVVRHLAFKTGALKPGRPTDEYQRFLGRRRTVEKLRKKAVWIAIAAVAPLSLLVWFTTQNPFYTFGVIVYFNTYILAEIVLRMRGIGMAAKWQVLFFWFMWFPLFVGWTVVMIMSAAGTLPT